MTLQALILAAGCSRRFPVNKLLKALPSGQCLLDISYQLASSISPDVLIVINGEQQVQRHCQIQHFPFVINPRAQSGIASSIAIGVSNSATANAWAIFLADMPCIKTSTLHHLADSWQTHEVVIPTFQGQNGHPVIFSRDWYTPLCSLQGDRGARDLLQDNTAVHRLEVDDAGVCFDIDTETDWLRYLNDNYQFVNN